MFTTLVVTLDLGPDGDSTVPTAHAPSRADEVAVDLVTATSTGLPSALAAGELECRRFTCAAVIGDLDSDGRARDRLEQFGVQLAAHEIHPDIDPPCGHDPSTGTSISMPPFAPAPLSPR